MCFAVYFGSWSWRWDLIEIAVFLKLLAPWVNFFKGRKNFPFSFHFTIEEIYCRSKEIRKRGYLHQISSSRIQIILKGKLLWLNSFHYKKFEACSLIKLSCLVYCGLEHIKIMAFSLIKKYLSKIHLQDK